MLGYIGRRLLHLFPVLLAVTLLTFLIASLLPGDLAYAILGDQATPETVAALRARGLDLVILSGDRPEAVRPIAARLGISDWRGGLKPAEKIAAIEALKREGRHVLMVGDGLNDAPALAAAHVSLSPISAADITQAQADAVFLGERLGPVVDAVTVAQRARRLMQQNLWLAVLYNAAAVPVAIAGLATPLIAAAAMSGSSILVTLNALRVRARKPARSVAASPTDETLAAASAT